MTGKTTESILEDAKETLNNAKIGLAMMRNPASRRSGLRNVVVFGRAVTNVLQNLRSTEPSFKEWYAIRVTQMAADPLMKYFYQLRSEVL